MSIQTRWKKLTSDLRMRVSRAKFDEHYRKLRSKYPHRRYLLVLTLCKVKLSIDADRNHVRPHIHCGFDNNEHATSIAIDDGTVLAGSLPTKKLRIVREWLSDHQIALNRIWHEMRNGQPVDALICELKERNWTPRRKIKHLCD